MASVSPSLPLAAGVDPALSTRVSSLRRALDAAEARRARSKLSSSSNNGALDAAQTDAIAAMQREYTQLHAQLQQQLASTPAAPATPAKPVATSAPAIRAAAKPAAKSSFVPGQRGSFTARRSSVSSVRISAGRPAVAASAAAAAAAALSTPAAPAAPAHDATVPSRPPAPLAAGLMGLNSAPSSLMLPCPGARHSQLALKRKRASGGLMARMGQLHGLADLTVPATPATQWQTESAADESEQHDESHDGTMEPHAATTSSRGHAADTYSAEDDHDMEHELDIEDELRREEIGELHENAAISAPSASRTASHRSFISSRSNGAAAMHASVTQTADSADPFALSDDADEEVARPAKRAARATRSAKIPAARRAPLPRSKRARAKESEEEDEAGEGSNFEGSSDEFDVSDSSADEDAPIRSLLPSRAAAAASSADGAHAAAKTKAPRKSRAKPAKEKIVKPRTAVSTNYVRSDDRHKIKNGTGRAGKSAKALRKEKWRQSQGLDRWKSKSEWAREKKEAKDDALYCEVLGPAELGKHLAREHLSAAAGDVSSDHGTDDELERLRDLECARFGSSSIVTKAEKAAQQLEAQRLDASITAADNAPKPLPPRRALASSVGTVAAASASADPTSHTPASLRRLLQKQFGYDDFKPGQLDAITRVLGCKGVEDNSSSAAPPSGRRSMNVLAILPTGGGKTLIYQLLSFLLPGLTLVVSPLLSLMRDQLEHLPHFLPGAVWSSELLPKEVLSLMEKLTRGEIKVLFVSPEKLLTHAFQRFMMESLVAKNLQVGGAEAPWIRGVHASSSAAAAPAASPPSPGVSLVVVDEAHCMAEWSHNFRNSYSRLDYVLHSMLRVPRILGLTATATVSTTHQVCSHLAVPQENIVRAPLRRSNLLLSVSHTAHETRFQAIVALLSAAPFKGLHSLVIYVSYQKSAEALSKYLQQQGFGSCAHYHAGLTLAQRHSVQSRFMRNKLSIVVATCAFGMGLDKRDIRGVIHASMPRSFESYIQEIGRAGRDGNQAFCHVLWDGSDETISRSLLYTNGVDKFQLRKLMNKIFEGGHRLSNAMQQPAHSSMMLLGEEEVLSRRLVYAALEVEHLRTQMELSEEVVGTILARLERSGSSSSASSDGGGPWIRLMSCMHNTAAMGFHKSNPKVLAHTSPVVRALLEQNKWIQRGASNGIAGMSFDHERAQTMDQIDAVASSEFTATEFAHLKQNKGFLSLNLVEAAMDLGWELTEVQREIMRLKWAGEISVNWSDMSFFVQVLRAPVDEGGENDGHASTLDSLVDEVAEHLRVQEDKSSEKLSIMATAMRIASIPSMRCSVQDAVGRATRWTEAAAKEMRAARAAANLSLKADAVQLDGAADTAAAEEEDDDADEEEEFFDLHLVMDAYFQAEDHTAFLQQLQNQQEQVESAANASRGITAAPKKLTNFKLERELETDLHEFVLSHGDALRSGRELARIFHGLHAPSAAAQSRSSESHARFHARGDPQGVSTSAALVLSAWVGTQAWGRHRAVPFPTVLAKAEEALQAYKLSAGKRLDAMQAEAEKRRAQKRAKLTHIGAPPPFAAPKVASMPASSIRPTAAPSSRAAASLRAHVPAPQPSLPADDDDIVIAASDDEEEEPQAEE